MAINKGTREQAIALLGNGIPSESVASALGVSASRISQMLAEEDFSAAVAEKKLVAANAIIERDNKADTIEDKLLEKLTKSLPLMIRPELILKAYKVINEAKRRSTDSVASTTQINQVVNLNLPTKVIASYTVNNNNQVVEAGGKTMVPMQSGNLQQLLPKAITEEDL